MSGAIAITRREMTAAELRAASATRPGGRGLGATSYLMGGIAAVWFVGRVAAF